MVSNNEEMDSYSIEEEFGPGDIGTIPPGT